MVQIQRLGEGEVSNAFHVYLKSALGQAKRDHLLDAELLSSAEADLMITGPSQLHFMLITYLITILQALLYVCTSLH